MKSSILDNILLFIILVIGLFFTGYKYYYNYTNFEILPTQQTIDTKEWKISSLKYEELIKKEKIILI